MRRAPIVLAATAAGFVGVLSFHTTATSIQLPASATGASATGGTSAAGGSGTASSGGASARASKSTGSSASGAGSGTGTAASSGAQGSGAGSSGGTGGGAAAGPATTAPGSGTSSTAVRSATGTDEQYGYGALAVKVIVKGTRITDVKVASIQEADPTSAQIASEVIPMLRSEVLSAQSARINAISGATYTSEAYAYSLQAALDKLHLK